MTSYPRWQKDSLEHALAARRVVMLTGARQCGKTTLAKTIVADIENYKTLDNAPTRLAAEKDPQLFVEHARKDGTLVIDEIQKVPDLLPAIKKVVDENNRPGQFLLTGSANIFGLPTVQESLAGRISRVRLRPLSQGEILGTHPVFIERAFAQEFARARPRCSRNDLIDMIFRGGFPEAIRLKGKARKQWHIDYVDALVEHDVKDVAQIRQIDVMKDLVKVLAAWSSKFMDVSTIASKLAVDRRTLANYISLLQSFYIIESVPAWIKTDYDRVGKQGKSFMLDTGMMTALLDWDILSFADNSDKIGKAFETFAYNEIIAQIDAAEESYHLSQYRDHDKREIDFLIEQGERRILAIDIKSGISIRKSDFKHMEWFRNNLAKDKSFVGIILYAGDDILPFGENLWVVPFDCLWAT